MGSLFTRFSAILLPPTDLWRAAKLGDVATIAKLVAAGENPNAKKQTLNTEGDTPLHLAARHDQPEAIKVLVELGANINSRNNHGTTPLMEAAANTTRESTIETLIGLGAALNAQDAAGGTALTAAAFAGDEGIVQALLKRGANPNQQRGPKKSEVLTHAIWGKNRKVFDLLLSAGADPGCSGDVCPAIQTAAVYGLDSYVEKLLRAGADPSTKDSSGFPTILAAVRGKNLRALQLLIDAGADVNARDSAGETALDIACKIKRKDMIDLLRKAGAKHGRELPQRPVEPEARPVWELRGDVTIAATLNPWPARRGAAVLKAELSASRELEGGWSVQYRIRCEGDSDREWEKMFPAANTGETDEGDEVFEADVVLESGTWLVEFQVAGRMHDEPDFLSDWSITVAKV